MFLYGCRPTTIVCPRCGLRMVERVRRSFFEKLITKKRKYHCYFCTKKFFIKKPPLNIVHDGTYFQHKGKIEDTIVTINPRSQ